jgi:hypothetical protein
VQGEWVPFFGVTAHFGRRVVFGDIDNLIDGGADREEVDEVVEVCKTLTRSVSEGLSHSLVDASG